MTMTKLEMILNSRGLTLNTVVYKTIASRFELPSATFIGFFNGFECWLGFRSNIIYRIAQKEE